MIVWAKTQHVRTKTEVHLLPQLTTTLNNYACSLPPLVIIDWSAFPECFSPTILIHDWWNGTKGGLKLGCGELICLPLSVHVCTGLIVVVEYWPFVDACIHHSYSKLYYLCHFAALFKLLPPPTPPPHLSHPPTHPLIYFGPILMNSMKTIIKNWWKTVIIYLPGYSYKS